MHRSRLYALFVDTPRADYAAATEFWSAAFGATPEPEPGDADYTRLQGALTGHALEVQAIDGDDGPRYHLDIESDDPPAEIARLVALGAEVVAPHGGWAVLRAPGGHLVCVVPVQSDADLFASTSTAWP